MHFDNSFSVPKPIDEVWATMLDLERVIPCVPNARVLEKADDDEVTAEIVERDDDAHRAVLSASAREARGQGNARAKVEIRLTGAGEGTEAELHSDVTVTGRAAAMGEGVIAGVTEAMINQFAENLAKI